MTPYRLYLIQLGQGRVAGPAGSFDVSIGCYLVQMGDGESVLIDSGPPPEGLPPLPGQIVDWREVGDVVQHLADLGLRPKDVGVVVCTQLAADHAGRHDAFPNAEFIVQRRHYEHARRGSPLLDLARAHWDRPELCYRLVDGDTELRPGLTLIETSGHTLGHQSVLVRLPRTGPVLLAADAVVVEYLFTPDRQAVALDEDGEQLRASTRKLLDLAEREGVGLVVFHHDGAQWRRLKRAPEYYD